MSIIYVILGTDRFTSFNLVLRFLHRVCKIMYRLRILKKLSCCILFIIINLTKLIKQPVDESADVRSQAIRALTDSKLFTSRVRTRTRFWVKQEVCSDVLCWENRMCALLKRKQGTCPIIGGVRMCAFL